MTSLPTFPTLPPTVPTNVPTFPTLPPTVPTNVPTASQQPTFPTLPPTVPTNVPTASLQPTFPTLPPTVPTNVPTFPTLPPTVPTNVPTASQQPTFPTLPPTVPTNVPTASPQPTFPTLPPTVPTNVPTFPTLPPTVPTNVPTASQQPTFPTLPPTVPTNVPTFPTLPPTVPTNVPTFPTLPPTVPTATQQPTFPTLPPTVPTASQQPTFPTLPPTVPTNVPTIPTFPTLQPTVTVTNTLPTFPTLSPTVTGTGTFPTFPSIPTVTVTVPTFPTLNPGTPLNCPDGVVLCPVPATTPLPFPPLPGQIDPRPANNTLSRQGVLPNGCPCIDPRNSAIGILLQAYQIAQNCYSPDNLPGICINIQNCAFLYRLVQNGDAGPLGSLGAYIKKSLCGYDGYDLLVCCPTQLSPAVTQSIPQYSTQFTFSSLTSGTTATASTVTPSQTPIPTPTPTPSNSMACGVSNFTQTRVVGGGPAKVGKRFNKLFSLMHLNKSIKGQYPWIAALGYTGSSGNLQFNCAGSLITQKHVLSTAHCINNNLYLARLGEYDLTSTNDGASPIDIVIDQRFVHEQYDSKIIYNDISLLKLRDYAPVTDQIRPICLPLNEPLRSRDLTGYQPFIAGWGAVSYQGPVSPILQEAQIPIVSTADCERNYRVYFPNQIFDNRVLCAGYGGRDSCQGDSGGHFNCVECGTIIDKGLETFKVSSKEFIHRNLIYKKSIIAKITKNNIVSFNLQAFDEKSNKLNAPIARLSEKLSSTQYQN
ncbi:Venom serine protease Bi-VSP [Pseudolycoriella hygida]|uniref:Venom serine protease Bi-VSP n=1 Tax=Pseudolycoriella hygida TaxID=35572 RepID=A0A9Q0MN13_9DIPT|nr:Venom serine protease Bi-VSP [Pseudolycoriella hygida]